MDWRKSHVMSRYHAIAADLAKCAYLLPLPSRAHSWTCMTSRRRFMKKPAYGACSEAFRALGVSLNNQGVHSYAAFCFCAAARHVCIRRSGTCLTRRTRRCEEALGNTDGEAERYLQAGRCCSVCAVPWVHQWVCVQHRHACLARWRACWGVRPAWRRACLRPSIATSWPSPYCLLCSLARTFMHSHIHTFTQAYVKLERHAYAMSLCMEVGHALKVFKGGCECTHRHTCSDAQVFGKTEDALRYFTQAASLFDEVRRARICRFGPTHAHMDAQSPMAGFHVQDAILGCKVQHVLGSACVSACMWECRLTWETTREACRLCCTSLLSSTTSSRRHQTVRPAPPYPTAPSRAVFAQCKCTCRTIPLVRWRMLCLEAHTATLWPSARSTPCFCCLSCLPPCAPASPSMACSRGVRCVR